MEKKNYEKPVVEAVVFNETEIKTDNSVIDFGIGDWFEEGDY